jgi:nucleoside-diphosphate-sugar epimerase
MGKHVVVGAGGVGGGVARELAGAGHEVVVVSRSGRAPTVDGVRAVALDATDADALTTVARGADALYNCANPPHYHRWAREWPPLAASLLAAAMATGAGLVTMGNLYGYGEVDGPIDADRPLAPSGRNGAIRAGMWEDALAAHRSGRVRVTEARASDFLGPESGAQAHLGDRIFPRVLAGKKVWALGAADVPHSWTYVPDAARTLAVLGTDDRSWGRAWLVPSNPPVSQRDAVAAIADAAGVPVPPIGVLTRPMVRTVGIAVPTVRALGEVLHQFERPFVLDASSTTATFGLEPTPWAECIRTTLATYTSATGAAVTPA